MSKNLVIVESPAKAKTIEGYLGKDFLVTSSFGHVRDLAKNGLGIDIAHGFEPIYEVMAEKQKMIKDLKKMADKAETVWLATDEDREGEAISWHLAKVLKLDVKRTKRIVFHEITKQAITNAIEHPRTIDENLVNAQQARRVLDRLVGFEISPILWKKVKPSLSAGRVQSVAVRLIVEREDEIRHFKSSFAYRVSAIFDIQNSYGKAKLKAELPKRFATKAEAKQFLENCNGATFKVADIETKPGKKSPAPPFTTSTLQQEASRKLGYGVSKTMMIAQQLYEGGKITYMRTDSVNLSETALGMARDEITRLYGKEFHKSRQYSTKTKGAQEAHEAIRPSYMQSQTIDGTRDQQRLYELIWKRTIASQMADAILEKTNVTIDISTNPLQLVAQGEVVKFEGFLKVYFESTDDEAEQEEGMLPPMKQGEVLGLEEITAVQKFALSPPRYTEASLVKKLEELGIGRPSTYAPTISTIQKREYVVKEDRDGIIRDYDFLILKNSKVTETVKQEKTGFEKSKLFPTDTGELVTKFLLQFFDNIMDYNFTASVEKEFDEVAQGLKEWNKMIGEFYKPFHQKVEDTLQSKEKVKGERLLGVDPKSGQNVYVKLGRFGPMVQIGESDAEEKPKFAGLQKGQSMDSMDLATALKLFEFPKTIGEYEGKELKVNNGRFGPYVLHNNKFYSLAKTDNLNTITQERAIEIIVAKQQAEANKLIREFSERPDVKVLNGRYGPYVQIGKENFKIPKTVEPASLTLEDCLKLAETPKSSSKQKTAAKAVAKPAAAKSKTKSPQKKTK